jgi:hypothetical protein
MHNTSGFNRVQLNSSSLVGKLPRICPLHAGQVGAPGIWSLDKLQLGQQCIAIPSLLEPCNWVTSLSGSYTCVTWAILPGNLFDMATSY